MSYVNIEMRLIHICKVSVVNHPDFWGKGKGAPHVPLTWREQTSASTERWRNIFGFGFMVGTFEAAMIRKETKQIFHPWIRHVCEYI